MSNTFLESLREKRDAKTALIAQIVDRAAEEVRDITEVELANVEALNLEVKKLDERIEQMSDIELRNAKAADLAAKVDANKPIEKRVEQVKVGNEPLTYHTRSEHSFLSDAVKDYFNTDIDASDRIRRRARTCGISTRSANKL